MDILVEGFKLGGRAKRIFVDVVKEDLKLDGGGGGADWPSPLSQGTASQKRRKCSSGFRTAN